MKPNSHPNPTNQLANPVVDSDLVFISTRDLGPFKVTVDPGQLREIENQIITLNQTDAQIASELNTISQTLQGSGSNDLVLAIIVAAISAFTGALAAFLFSLLQSSITQRRSAMSAGANEMLSLLAEIEAVSVEYWLCSPQEGMLRAQHAQEIKMKTLLRLVAGYSTGLQSLKVPKTQKATFERINKLVSVLFELVTGDDFESPDREASKPTALKIASRCAEIRRELYQVIHF